MLSEQKIAKLVLAQEFCDDMDKSTEFMIQFMQDMAECSHDEVMEFLNNGCGTSITTTQEGKGC